MPRRGGVSAFGFGGTNFHVVCEEHVPGRYQPTPRTFAVPEAAPVSNTPTYAAAPAAAGVTATVPGAVTAPVARKTPLRGALVLGGRDEADLLAQVQTALAAAKAGSAPAPAAPDPALAGAPVRIAVDYGDAAELAGKLEKLVMGAVHRQPRDLQDAAAAGRVPRSRAGAQGRLPLHRPGLAVRQHAPRALRPRTARQATTFDAAGPRDDPTAGAPADLVHLRRPDRRGGGEDRDRASSCRPRSPSPRCSRPTCPSPGCFAAYGIEPDMVMGHSLGEYGALVAARRADASTPLSRP
ncbi:MAG: hypothetical protein V9G08_10665 [Dermatophilaceae bacterium]